MIAGKQDMEAQMERPDIFKNGATWLRADFHLHTIRDKEFKSIDSPNDFFKQFIARLKEEKIHIGIITNHNKFDRDEYRNLRKAAKKDDIWILSGVELSVNDGANGIHCLVAFDDQKWLTDSEDYIDQFLTAAFEGIANRENENTRCNYNFESLLKKLDEHRRQGRDSFIILAHAQQNSGFFKELDGGRIQQFAECELFKQSVLAIQKIRNYDNIEKYRSWFGGNLPALVEGSDCKSIEEVGKATEQNGQEKKTYIKIGDFNFEALKYALLDATDRVKTEIPQTQNSYIKSIHFDGGKLNGQTIDFSPELNNFIGIRGSGKSSVIEIIRYALGIPLSSSSADILYKNDLISYILGSGGKVTLFVVNKTGKKYRIEKIYGQKETIFDEMDQVCDCSIDAVFELPIYFGQKDLSNKKDDFESDLLKRLIGTRLKTIHQQTEAKKREVQNVLLEIQKSRDLKAEKEETEKAIRDAEQRLQYFKEQGIEEKLRLQTQFDKDSSLLSRARESFVLYQNELDSIINTHVAFFSKDLSGSEQNKLIFEEANKALADAKVEFEKLRTIQQQTNAALQKYDVAFASLNTKKEGMKESFAKIKRELNSDTLNPDTFLSLNRIIDTSKLKLLEISKLEKQQIELRKQLLTRLAELNDLWTNEFRILNEETQKINTVNGSLKIEIKFKGCRKAFSDKLKEVFRGTGLRDSVYQALSEQFQDFIEIYREKDNLGDFINENQMGSFNLRFQDKIAELLTYKVENRVTINYKEKPLEKHSLGQRASALILFLLAQKDNDVLIIDQPEDDLDNQTIYDEVIKELIKLKGQMQFIFATHNANIPVLGDSEKVLSCSFEDTNSILVNAGTIDTPSIQESVIGIMEGGEEAFDKRKNIYSIWDV